MSKQKKIKQLEYQLNVIIDDLQCALSNAYKSYNLDQWEWAVKNVPDGLSDLSNYLNTFIEKYKDDESEKE